MTVISISTEVGMTEPGFASRPDGLFTGGVGPCIAVAFLNATSGKAALIHSAGMAQTAALHDFISSISSPAPNDECYIVITGGDITEDGPYGTAVAEDRKAVERDITQAFPSVQPRIFWRDQGWVNVRISTDPPLITVDIHTAL